MSGNGATGVVKCAGSLILESLPSSASVALRKASRQGKAVSQCSPRTDSERRQNCWNLTQGR